jgi:hypothetical protein
MAQLIRFGRRVPLPSTVQIVHDLLVMQRDEAERLKAAQDGQAPEGLSKAEPEMAPQAAAIYVPPQAEAETPAHDLPFAQRDEAERPKVAQDAKAPEGHSKSEADMSPQAAATRVAPPAEAAVPSPEAPQGSLRKFANAALRMFKQS